MISLACFAVFLRQYKLKIYELRHNELRRNKLRLYYGVALPIRFGLYIHKGHTPNEARPCIKIPYMVATHRLN